MVKVTCRQCGKEFTISDSEIRFYKEKNLKLPKRCKECRAKNKQQNGAVAPYKENRQQKPADLGMDLPKKTTNDSACKNKTEWNNVKRLMWRAFVIVAFLCAVAKASVEYDWFPSTDTSTKQMPEIQEDSSTEVLYTFRKLEYLNEHFEKHRSEFAYETQEEYLAGANAVIANKASLHKKEKEDNDDIYYLESTNEFVVLSTDGYLRTYFKPENGKAYYDEQ